MITFVFTCGAVYAQTRAAPHIGYLYPAGGQRGTTFTVSVGGPKPDLGEAREWVAWRDSVNA